MTDIQNPARCPLRELLARLGDKWSMLVIMSLAQAEGNCLRFSEIKHHIAGISQRMLTTTLRYLERDGIVTRRVYPEVPPRVEYRLTQRGTSLLVPVKSMVTWVEQEWPQIEVSRREFDRSRGENGGI